MSRQPKHPHSHPHSSHDAFATIDLAQLEQVSGGASRVSSRSSGSNDQLTAMLTQVTDSIKDLAKNQSSGMDPMMMMLMMMTMGGGGGGAAAPVAAAAPAASQPTPVINISTNVRRNC